jgi:hypothetical protein
VRQKITPAPEVNVGDLNHRPRIVDAGINAKKVIFELLLRQLGAIIGGLIS